MPYSVNNGVRSYYEVYGEGRPLVLIHANPFDRRLWTYQIARFSPFYKVIAMDLRGYGNTDKPENPFTLSDLTDDVLAICDREGVQRAIFAGVSVGSGIAMYLSLHHAQRVDAQVLVGGSARGPGDNLKKIIDGFAQQDLASYLRSLMVSYFAPGFSETSLGRWWIDAFLEKANTLSAKSIAQVFTARGTYDMSGMLADIKAPTLVINGEYDVSLAAGGATAKGIPGAKHVMLPNTGHACNLEDPTGFEAAMIGFLQANGLWTGPRQPA
jgi:pimeloyl-ACP methyl ester carboxylesterase